MSAVRTSAAPERSPLEARFAGGEEPIFINGVQAIVRLLLEQRRRDRAAGLNTAGFVSGYRGSPLGTLDGQLWAAKSQLLEHDIVFEPGLNEDLAATSVWGSQLAALNETRKVDGVFGLWYGKGPGVDRSADALKHANAAGTSPLGGVLAVAGDDHGASSSTLAHQSDQVFIAAMIPVLAPANTGEILEFGLLGYELSRFSGAWVALKAVTEMVEASTSVSPAAYRPTVMLPEGFAAPMDGLHIRWPDSPLAMERRLLNGRLPAIQAFAAANRIDRRLITSPRPRLGIVAPGKAANDVVEALALLGLDETSAAARGISLYKPGLVWPLEPSRLKAFAAGHETLLVVEEKRPVVEEQIARILYGSPDAPRLIGKTDESGAPLIPAAGVLDAATIALVLADRLLAFDPGDDTVAPRAARLRHLVGARPAATPPARPPYFCAGCPHNVSTKVPDGSRAMAGIGCHGMASWVPDRVIQSMSHMGGEGMHWIGQAPFVSEPHRFQNLGDGTYAHSGSLNIRAAAATSANITFKILYNDAVAMTGGQPVEGQLSVSSIARQVLADGAKSVTVVSDDPKKHAGSGLPPEVEVHHRAEMDAVQRRLREVPGVTVIIYEQMCATEKRRRRKRGKMPAPEKRVAINDRVCEGCGDCQRKSSCIAIEPLETLLGRKRTINQSSCNIDTSCVAGFCPSFVTVEGAKPRRRSGEATARLRGEGLAEPSFAEVPGPYNIVIPGIGGTGVVTISQILGMAAHLEDRSVTLLDMAGLAQKNGAVTSYLRLQGKDPRPVSSRVPLGAADLVLATDLVVANAPGIRELVSEGRTRIIANADVSPTLAFVLDGATDLDAARRIRDARQTAGEGAVFPVPAQSLALAVFGDAIAANMILVGYAWQKGLIPISFAAIDRAIEINGVAQALNRDAFLVGRLAAERPDELRRLTAAAEPEAAAKPLVETLAELLSAYHDEAYAARFMSSIRSLQAAEHRIGSGDTRLSEAAAASLHKLMAYKDEYEVARLHTDGAFEARLAREFEGDLKLTYHLAPPLLARRDPVTGEPRKIAVGSWIRPAFKLLARLKPLRGSIIDPFGHTRERRLERGLIREFEAVLARLAAETGPASYDTACRIAALPMEVRGYGHIKEAAIERYRRELAALMADFEAARDKVHGLAEPRASQRTAS